LSTRGPDDKKNAKLGQTRSWGSRDLLLEFWDTLHISGTVKARKFKFGTPMQNATAEI